MNTPHYWAEVAAMWRAQLEDIPIEAHIAWLREQGHGDAADLLERRRSDNDVLLDLDPVHSWFELSYAQYLTVPRSVLQSMPTAWQRRFVQCLEELDETIDWRPSSGRYWVQLKDGKGRYCHDPLMDYDKGRRVISRRDPVRERAMRFAQMLNRGRDRLPDGYPPLADDDESFSERDA